MNYYLLAAALVSTLGLLPSTTYALAKTLGGSACQISNENNLYLGRGSTDLGSTGAAFTAVCSLYRDNTTNTNGLSALQIRVNKFDSTSRSCTAHVHDAYGSSLKSVVKSVSGTGVRTFDWTNTLNVSSASAYYTVRCSLGGSDFIKSVYWNEPTPSELAGDAKIIPGNLCKSSMYSPLIRNTNRVTSGVGLFNGTFVQCGPLRDNFSLFSTLTSLVVRGYGGGVPSGGQDLSCDAVIGDGHDGYLLSVLKSRSTSGNFTFDFGAQLNTWAFNAQYGLECWLNNPQDAIYSVAWRE